jgi:hypothetical protein
MSKKDKFDEVQKLLEFKDTMSIIEIINKLEIVKIILYLIAFTILGILLVLFFMKSF